MIRDGGNPVILPDLRLVRGDPPMEIGQPTILPDPAVNIMDKFNSLLAEVVELRGRVERMESENEVLKERFSPSMAPPSS